MKIFLVKLSNVFKSDVRLTIKQELRERESYTFTLCVTKKSLILLHYAASTLRGGTPVPFQFTICVK